MLRTENIFQLVEINASPTEVFELLMDENKHSRFTQKSANIEAKEGGQFSFCNGNHTGYFVRIMKNKRIVLAWTHRKFPRNHYTIVDIQLEKHENGGTRLLMNQTGVPEAHDGWLTEAWRKTYWNPLEAYVQEEELVL